MRGIDSDEPVLLKSVPEHNEMRRLISELRSTPSGDVRHDQLLQQLMRDVIHHVADEETVLLPQAERLLSKDRLSELGADMTKRRSTGRPQSGQAGARHRHRLLRQHRRVDSGHPRRAGGSHAAEPQGQACLN
jgi:anaerobic glycerol-3-phosphate dehydrogenase